MTPLRTKALSGEAPLVSVITPAYNCEDFRGDAIESVLRQTYGNWELFVIDDGSADRTADIVRGYAVPRVKLIAMSHTGLPAVARNHGIERCKGELVAFLDGDDSWLPTKSEKQVALFRRWPEVGVVHRLPESGRQNEGRRAPAADRPYRAMEALFLQSFIFNSSVVVRKELLDEYGGCDEDPRLRGTEDYELWLRLAGVSLFACLDEPLLRYRERPDNITHSRTWRADAEAVIVALEKTRDRYPQYLATIPCAAQAASRGSVPKTRHC